MKFVTGKKSLIYHVFVVVQKLGKYMDLICMNALIVQYNNQNDILRGSEKMDKIKLLNSSGLYTFSMGTFTDYDEVLIEKLVNEILQNYPIKSNANEKHKYINLMIKIIKFQRRLLNGEESK